MTYSNDDSVTEIADLLVLRTRARIGQVLREKWHSDVLLGVGGMAAVFAATHRNESRVAIKILHRERWVEPHGQDSVSPRVRREPSGVPGRRISARRRRGRRERRRGAARYRLRDRLRARAVGFAARWVSLPCLVAPVS
jgi:hypothetical protein